jgi:hypothetical protein
MSIEATYQRLPPDKFKSVTENQESWESFRGVGFPGISIEEIIRNATNPNPAFSAKLLSAMEQRNNDPTRVELAKDWHVIYYLLTGSAEIAEEHRDGQDLHNLIFGGLKTAVQTGYGSVRYFDRQLVSQIASALRSVDHPTILGRFNQETFNRLGLYAAPDGDDQERDAIMAQIEQLKRLFEEAEMTGEFVLKYAD